MENSPTTENPLSLVSKTLSEKMKFVQNFEDLNQSDLDPSSNPITKPSLSQKNLNKPLLNSSDPTNISKKYADFLLASSNSQENLSFRNEKSELFAFLKKFEDSDYKDCISFENIEVFFREIGVFNENNIVNQDFLRNFKGILTLSEKNPDFMNINLVFQVFQLLIQEKVQINRIAALIQGILENYQRNFGIFDDFNILREEKGLWSVEKIILEFRKLIKSAEKEGNRANYIENPGIFRKELEEQNENPEDLKENGVETLKKDKKYYKTRYEMLFDHAKYLKEKQEMTHALKYMQDLHQFSFKPELQSFKKKTQETTTKLKSEKTKRNQHKSNEKNEENKIKDPIKNIKSENKDVWLDECFDRQYVNSKIKHQREEKYKDLHQKTLQDATLCTFKPNINKNQYSSNPSSELSVKGFDETVKRIIEARKEKQKIQKIYEEPLLRFPKNRKYMEQRETNYTVPEPFNFKGKEENEVLMFVDVEVGGGKSGRIGIHKGEDMEEVAKNFAKVYTLNKEKERKLAGNLKKQLENYYKNLNSG